MIDQEKLIVAQVEINRCRIESNRTYGRDPKEPRKKIIVKELKAGDKGYLPPETDFVTIEFHNGFVTVSAEYYKKLPKRKVMRLAKF